jgi:hypothetical protein
MDATLLRQQINLFGWHNIGMHANEFGKYRASQYSSVECHAINQKWALYYSLAINQTGEGMILTD